MTHIKKFTGSLFTSKCYVIPFSIKNYFLSVQISPGIPSLFSTLYNRSLPSRSESISHPLYIGILLAKYIKNDKGAKPDFLILPLCLYYTCSLYLSVKTVNHQRINGFSIHHYRKQQIRSCSHSALSQSGNHLSLLHLVSLGYLDFF